MWQKIKLPFPVLYCIPFFFFGNGKPFRIAAAPVNNLFYYLVPRIFFFYFIMRPTNQQLYQSIYAQVYCAQVYWAQLHWAQLHWFHVYWIHWIGHWSIRPWFTIQETYKIPGLSWVRSTKSGTNIIVLNTLE